MDADDTTTQPAPSAWRRLGRLITLDLRSLAVLRIGMALLILNDLSIRWPDIRSFYSDAGIMSRANLFGPLSGFHDGTSMTLYAAMGQPWQVQVVFIVNAILACLLLIGWRTRLMTVLCWVLLASIQYRFVMIGHGGDGILRFMMFWSMFLPLGARFSVDAALDRSGRTTTEVASMASVGLIVQIALVYVTSGALKTDELWHNGEALHYALHCDFYVRPFGIWLRDGFPGLLPLGTRVAMVLEFVGPLLLVIPWRHALWRTLGVFLFVGFHVLLYLMMDLGTITYICMVAWLALLPAAAWDWLEARFRRSDFAAATLRVAAGDTLADRLASVALVFLAARAVRYDGDAPGPHRLTLARAGGDDLTGVAALAELVRRSPWAWPAAGLVASGPVARALRALAGRLPRGTSPLLKSALPLRRIRLRPWPITSLLLAVALYWCVSWNMAMAYPDKWTRWHPQSLDRIAFSLGLEQYHNMFSPGPPAEDGWFVVRAELADGSIVNLVGEGTGVSFSKPEPRALRWQNERWNKLMFNISESDYQTYRPYVCDELRRLWQQAHPDAADVVMLDMYFMREMTTAEGAQPPEQLLLIQRHYTNSQTPPIPLIPDAPLGSGELMPLYQGEPVVE